MFITIQIIVYHSSTYILWMTTIFGRVSSHRQISGTSEGPGPNQDPCLGTSLVPEIWQWKGDCLKASHHTIKAKWKNDDLLFELLIRVVCEIILHNIAYHVIKKPQTLMILISITIALRECRSVKIKTVKIIRSVNRK